MFSTYSTGKSTWIDRIAEISVDTIVVTAITATFLAVAAISSSGNLHFEWLAQSNPMHLGAEYNHIAHSLAAGKGFSSPFGDETGPTAWMPPAIPMLISIVYLAGGGELVVCQVFFVVQVLSVLLAGYVVVYEARRYRCKFFGYAIFTAFCIRYFESIFLTTHDCGVLLLLVELLWLGTLLFWQPPSRRAIMVGWGLFGGLLALFSPVLASCWSCITVVRWRSRPWHLVLSIAMAVVLVSPWVVRNRLVLGCWYPIKSNTGYELWQAQCFDDDGVIDSSMIRIHPFSQVHGERISYAELGEAAYVFEKRGMAIRCILANPFDFFENAYNRFSAAFIWFVPFDSFEALGCSPLFVAKTLIHPLPFMSALVLLRYRVCMTTSAKAALMIWLLYLLPYVVVSFYERYLIPVMGMQMLIVLHGCIALQSIRGRIK